jgi:hypothetical protein
MTKNKSILLIALCGVAIFIAGKYLWNKKQADKKAVADLSDPAKSNTGTVPPVVAAYTSSSAEMPVTSGASLNASQQQQQQRLIGANVQSFMN